MGRHTQKKNLYYVQTDEDGYVVAISQTGNWQLDTVELNLSNYNLTGKFISTYRLVNGTLIQDPIKLAAVIAEQTQVANNRRIKYLKELLAQSDYISSKWMEEIVSLNNPLTWVADVIKINIKYTKEYSQLLKNRKAWRQEIQELGGED